VKKSGNLLINSGIQGYSLLKTTQVFLPDANLSHWGCLGSLVKTVYVLYF
jgi:hypothetical protein